MGLPTLTSKVVSMVLYVDLYSYVAIQIFSNEIIVIIIIICLNLECFMCS